MGKRQTAEFIDNLIDFLDTELADLRVIFLEIIKNYQSRVERDIDLVRNHLEVLKKNTPHTNCQFTELKNILSILRSIETKPERGRRKDLKKIEDTICEILNMTERLK